MNSLANVRPLPQGRVLSVLVAVSLVLSGLLATGSGAEAAEVGLVGSEFTTSSGNDQISIAMPESAAPNDLLLAVVSATGRRDVVGPEGWELVRSDHRSREITQTVWMRHAAINEPDSYTWNGRTTRAKTGAILAFTNATILDSATTTAAADAYRSHPIVVPSVDPATPVGLLVSLFSMRADGTIDAPDTMERIGEIEAGISTVVATETLSDAAATGQRIATRDASGGAVGHNLALARIPSPGQRDEHDTDEHDTDQNTDDPADDETHHDPDTDPEQDTGAEAAEASDWHDASRWPSNRVPGADDDIVIDGHVVLQKPAQAGTITVSRGSTLEFAKDASATLSVEGNVVVEGTLRMGSKDRDRVHLLRFVGIDETAYVGGGHKVIDSDVGLWFVGHGRAVVDGADQRAWSRSAGSLDQGGHKLELEDLPTGWRVGDDIVITPTSAPGTPGHSDGYSEGQITAISGKTIRLDTPFAYDHPRINGQWGAEVMNMTRNVRIEGTPGGRAHVMFSHTHGAQHLRNATLRHMGPRQDTGDTYRSSGERAPIYEGVMGRYPLHFHHTGAGSIGSIVENVVVQDSGFRAFVAHASDGIKFQDTIAHNVFDDAYWWDTRTGCCGHHAVWEPGSNDVSYDRSIASLVKTDPPFRGYRLAGFELGHGSDMSVTNSVAVGVQGNRHASGFKWPEGSSPTEDDHWTFKNNVSHNNRMNGIFVWQNTSDPRHHVEDSVLYHNGQDGINHGAYSNPYHYQGLTLHGNGRSGVELHAQGHMRFTDTVFDGAGVSQYGFQTAKHRRDRGPTVVRNGTFRGYTDAGVAFLAEETVQLDIIDPRFERPQATWFHLADRVPASSIIRVQLRDGSAFRLHPMSSSVGVAVDDWNARREPIAPFD